MPELYKKPHVTPAKMGAEIHNDSWIHPLVPDLPMTWEMLNFPSAPYLETLKKIIHQLEKKHNS